jgi:ABC-type lipoprotein export system ATPase subunit
MTALTLDEVTKTRGEGPHAVQALRDVSLTVAAGEIVLLEGPSGAGKTTLLAVAAGLLMPERGQALVDGVSLASLSPARRRRHRAQRIGFVFQRANLLAGLTVRENVLLAATLGGLGRAEASRETAALLGRLGIAPLADRAPRALSGGEEQRAAVARALAHHPALVLADEPTGSLDGVSGLAVAAALAETARIRGAAVLIATHDARLGPIATRHIRITDGQLEPTTSP